MRTGTAGSHDSVSLCHGAREFMTLTLSRNPILHPPAPSVARVEAELRTLPHLREDRKHLARRARQSFRDARQAQDAATAIGKLPEADEVIHMVVCGRFSLWACVPAVLALSGRRIERLTVATLGFSRGNIDSLCELLDAGQIVGGARLLCSHYFAGTSETIYSHAATELGKRDRAGFLSLRTHAKVVAMLLDDGRTVTIHGSPNARSCKNIEQVAIEGHPAIYAFHVGWIDELFTAAARGRK